MDRRKFIAAVMTFFGVFLLPFAWISQKAEAIIPTTFVHWDTAGDREHNIEVVVSKMANGDPEIARISGDLKSIKVERDLKLDTLHIETEHQGILSKSMSRDRRTMTISLWGGKSPNIVFLHARVLNERGSEIEYIGFDVDIKKGLTFECITNMDGNYIRISGMEKPLYSKFLRLTSDKEISSDPWIEDGGIMLRNATEIRLRVGSGWEKNIDENLVASSYKVHEYDITEKYKGGLSF